MGHSLPPMPAAVERLPRDARGFPVPWFVAYVDGEPHFPTMDGRKLMRAASGDRCWVCGGLLDRVRAYVIGPMCVVNRTSGEPPSHPECAHFAATACPFLTNPRRRRRPRIDGQVEAGGIPVHRNPGVTVVWPTRGTQVRGDRRGGLLFDIGPPRGEVAWYAHGREATRGEAEESLDGGLAVLRDMATREGPAALLELAHLTARARLYLPDAEPPDMGAR